MIKLKNQNPKIGEKIDSGSLFNIIYTKEPPESAPDRYYQVVARASEDIRELIKAIDDRLYTDLESHRVTDRFYVRRCNKCQGFGHYHADCQRNSCCAFCKSPTHKSSDCPLKGSVDKSVFQCVNCEKAGKTFVGHSSHWGKCPCFLEAQEKIKQSIPYYCAKN